MLASLSGRYESELRADFQQYYGLDFDNVQADCSAWHAACLAAELPRCSRVARAINSAAAWGYQEHLLADIANSLRFLCWSKTKDAERGLNRPESIRPPTQETKIAKERITDPDEYVRRLKEVDECHRRSARHT